jgi:hypothetical protein
MLLRRAGALQKKQRAGHVAPPTPASAFRRINLSPFTPASEADYNLLTPSRGPSFTGSLSRGPSFTGSLPRGSSFTANATPFSPFAATPSRAPSFSGEKGKGRMLPPMPIPVTLRAPRYNHLMQAAIAVSKGEAAPQEHAFPVLPEADFEEDTTPDPPAPAPTAAPFARAEKTVGKMVKGFFWSYLSTAKDAPAPPKPKAPEQPALPLPPPEAYARSRPEKFTPARPQSERAPVPKELVELQPAPAPAPAGPARRDPRRLIDLRHVSPPPSSSPPGDVPRSRRRSGSSVKDLVQSFEAMESFHHVLAHEAARKVQLRRMRSGGSMKKPVWKP